MSLPMLAPTDTVIPCALPLLSNLEIYRPQAEIGSNRVHANRIYHFNRPVLDSKTSDTVLQPICFASSNELEYCTFRKEHDVFISAIEQKRLRTCKIPPGRILNHFDVEQYHCVCKATSTIRTRSFSKTV